MKLKLDAEGHAVLQDGKPVYVHDDGKEVAFDAPAAVSKISALNGEAQGHRQAKEAAESKLAAFAGIDDAAAAKRALETIANLDQKKLIDAGEVENVKKAAIDAVRAEYEPVVKERDQLKTELYDEKVGGQFSRSKYLSDKVAVPSHMVQNTFGKNFKIEDGKTVAYDANGNKIFSRTRPGEVADFDEAIELLISADPYKDHILKGNVGAGGGAGQGAGGGIKRQMQSSEFNELSAAERAAAMAAGTVLID